MHFSRESLILMLMRMFFARWLRISVLHPRHNRASHVVGNVIQADEPTNMSWRGPASESGQSVVDRPSAQKSGGSVREVSRVQVMKGNFWGLPAARLRHIARTKWSLTRYMSPNLLKQKEMVA
jgi:hypothetical protein